MAKLNSHYGSTPLILPIFSDLFPNSFSSEEYLINADPFDFLEQLPSIYGDLQKNESDMIIRDCSSYDCGTKDLEDIDIKPKIRNSDVMWSGQPSSRSLSTSASSMCSDIGTTAPFSAVMDNWIQIKNEKTSQQQQPRLPSTVVAAKKLNYLDVVISNNQFVNSTDVMQKFPRGTSLEQVRDSSHIPIRCDQLPSVTNTVFSSQSTTPSSYRRYNTSPSVSSSPLNTNSSSSSNYLLHQRPETPHRLDDDRSMPEFKHNVDLRTCIMGSNCSSLTSDPASFFNRISQQLQDITKNKIDTRLISGCSFTGGLDVINSTTADMGNTTGAISSSTTTTGGYSNYRSVNASGSLDFYEFDSDAESNVESIVSNQSSNSSTHYMKHNDHSYTRCKDDMHHMSTNIETPSDSEEEIDVVSVITKKLDTKRSDKDRRNVHSMIAHKFNAAHIVKTPNNISTIPSHRRSFFEFPYAPASNSLVKSVNNTQYPSPTATPFPCQYVTKYVQQQQQQQQMLAEVVTDSNTKIPINILCTVKSRKHPLAQGVTNDAATIFVDDTTIVNAEIIGNTLPRIKKHRGSKVKLKRHFSLNETGDADTIEQRNLHNDMERQRRMGLKNLFEDLKKQIPGFKDKEVVPKVKILREATKLCEALTQEDQKLMEQKAKLKREMRGKQELLNQLIQQQRD